MNNKEIIYTAKTFLKLHKTGRIQTWSTNLPKRPPLLYCDLDRDRDPFADQHTTVDNVAKFHRHGIRNSGGKPCDKKSLNKQTGNGMYRVGQKMRQLWFAILL